MLWLHLLGSPTLLFFFFNDTATTEIYTLSLHDALPIYLFRAQPLRCHVECHARARARFEEKIDRKSTRLNSSHVSISYAVFCLKKKTGSAPGGRPRSGGGAPLAVILCLPQNAHPPSLLL